MVERKQWIFLVSWGKLSMKDHSGSKRKHKFSRYAKTFDWWWLELCKLLYSCDNYNTTVIIIFW